MHRSFCALTLLLALVPFVLTQGACAPFDESRVGEEGPDRNAKAANQAPATKPVAGSEDEGSGQVVGPSLEKPATRPSAGDDDPGAVADAEQDYFVIKVPKNPLLAGRMAEFKKTMETGGAPDRQNMIQDVCQLGDSDVLPYLVPVLGRGKDEDDQQVRMMTVGQIGKAFPSLAPGFFKQMITRGNATQVESALYAYGTMSHPGIARLVLPYMFHEDEKLRRAATFAMVAVLNPLAKSVLAHSSLAMDAPPHDHAEDHIPRTLYDRWADARTRLMDAIVARDLEEIPDEVFHALQSLADHEMTARFMRHYRSKAGPENEDVAEVVSKMFENTTRFLGRPKRLGVQTVEYVQYMYNVMSEKDKKFKVFFDSKMCDVLRARRLNLDRGMRLSLASDLLMINAHACEPELIEGDEGEKQIRFKMPLNYEIEAGVGSMNIYFWSGRTQGSETVVLTYDPETYLPIKEQIFTGGDNEIGTVEYGDYATLESGARVPLSMNVAIKMINGERIKRLRFEIAFQILQDTWFYKDSTTYLVNEEGEDEIRAIGEIQDVRVTRQVPDEL